jgi:hypothetical protein
LTHWQDLLKFGSSAAFSATRSRQSGAGALVLFRAVCSCLKGLNLAQAETSLLRANWFSAWCAGSARQRRYHVTIRRDPELLICQSEAETKGY